MKVIHSRDATWLNEVHGEWKRLAKPVKPEMATLLHMVDEAEAEKNGAETKWPEERRQWFKQEMINQGKAEQPEQEEEQQTEER